MAAHTAWQGKASLLSRGRATVFFDGIFTEPQLNHPEGIAIDREGNIWCGGERGEIFRIAQDGSTIEQLATSGGFTLGLAFDQDGKLYSCDLRHRAVYRLDPASGSFMRFADGDGKGRKMRTPNSPVVDAANRYLYVSDSFDSEQEGPGIWRFDILTGEGSMWYDQPLRFANGLAFAPGGNALYVAETFARRVSRIPFMPDGTAGTKETVVELDALPDGLAVDAAGRLYICCYEPSLIYRYASGDGLELLYYDEEAHTLCHPTNCAFRGKDLFTSNLGRWHITRLSDVL